MKYSSLCLVLTDRCTASCDFCGFSCGPDRQQVMPQDMMARIIREAAEMGITGISFSGGEPFLYPELLIDGARMAHEAKMKVGVTSNGFWGAWDEARRKELLNQIKPDYVSFSHDHFHQKYVPTETLIQAVETVFEQDISPRIFVADMQGDYSAGRFMQSLDARAKYGIEYVIYPAYRCGRAMNMPEEMFLMADYRPRISCLYENTLAVMYNGDVYPCCRFQAHDSQLKLGNVADQTLSEMIAQSEVSRICAVLMNSERFNRLLDLARQEGIDVDQKAGCSCDYCRMMFDTQQKREKMRPHVESLYGEMLVASLMREVGNQ